LRKLQRYGIQGPLNNWLESFLTDRYQTVVCDTSGYLATQTAMVFVCEKYSKWRLKFKMSSYLSWLYLHISKLIFDGFDSIKRFNSGSCWIIGDPYTLRFCQAFQEDMLCYNSKVLNLLIFDVRI
jgi:hypothetical protein